MNILEQTEPLTAEVRAYARTYPKGFDIPLHRHAWGQLIYARAGVMTVTVASPAQPGSWVVPPQRALWVPAETDHWIRCGTRFRCARSTSRRQREPCRSDAAWSTCRRCCVS